MKTVKEAAINHSNNLNITYETLKNAKKEDFEKSFKAGAEFVIDELVSKFEQLKQSATTLRDVVYLDGVLTVIESMKIENNN